ncbi:MAG: endonuclease III, partial [Candidatus Aminicenantes bacterium]|nr:endonuclease III [Candidatus Aminicenantes bacterium]
MVNRKEARRVFEIIRILEQEYGEATCALHHDGAYQLLVATILSAQCTDARVNMVTPALFRRYPDAHAMAEADLDELQEIIRSTGFFRNKSKSLHGSATKLVDEFDGEVPSNMRDLLKLPGVARKTANVVLGTAYGIASGVVVDTHVGRLSRRLGLTHQKTPVKVEKDLMGMIPRDEWINFAHRLIHHGRRV